MAERQKNLKMPQKTKFEKFDVKEKKIIEMHFLCLSKELPTMQKFKKRFFFQVMTE
jgi:hypothetical protein